MREDVNLALQKELEKKYGKEVDKDPRKHWDTEKEEKFLAENKEKTKKNYIIKKGKEKVEKDGILLPKDFVESPNKLQNCSTCGKKYSNNFADQVYIKKFGVCYNCYIKVNL